MALELETFFELHFIFKDTNCINIIENKTNDKTLYYNELSLHTNLFSDILIAIENELNHEKYHNDANIFSNYIRNGWTQNMNATKMNDFLLNNIKMVNSFNEKSKEIIINFLDILLSDNFEKNDNIKRSVLYYQKIMNETLVKWKKSNYCDYIDDINEFNILLRANNICLTFTQYIDVFNITGQLNNIDNSIKIILLDFFEKLIIKYNKQDKIKEKLVKIKSSKEIPKPKSPKEIKPTKVPNSLKQIEPILESESVKIKKKKKSISSTIKKLVWNTNIGEEKGKSKCLCCKSTEITQMSFHCGHIIAESNGGETIVSNLKPICQNCNSSMGSKNMNEFMKSLK
jgi:hypothetical protein